MKSGLVAPEILFPNVKNLSAWAVIACDQFTSEAWYWDELKEYIKDEPSALNVVLPEIYLNDNAEKRIKEINSNIEKYIETEVLKPMKKGFILLRRSTPYSKKRLGLICALDLEEYDYREGTTAPIRATEKTIPERIPPRLAIRKDAYAEFTHVMVLYDDASRSINEKLYENKEKYTKLYDFDLNMGGGHVEGYFIEDYEEVIKKFDKLAEKIENGVVFAVGDGNHSLATAKTHWNNLKTSLSEKERENHPARYALVELVNIYDEGIRFEPIYRFVKGINVKELYGKLKKECVGKFIVFDGELKVIDNGKTLTPEIIKSVDKTINEFIEKNGGEVDYVHGEENLKKLVLGEKNSLGVLLDKMDKSELFSYVQNYGLLPKKTFSMGEGVEKRYYLEGKKIK